MENIQFVPAASFAAMGTAFLFAFAIPALTFLIFKKKFGCSVKPFFIGCGSFVIFALILEALLHSLILGNGRGELLTAKPLLYSLYGGFMAGLFEESGRFLAFKTILKKDFEDDSTALAYGAGHGGFEAFYILLSTMLTNLVFSIMINTGNTEVITKNLTPELLKNIEGTFESLRITPPAHYLLSIVERLAGVVIHISLSVIVWFGAKNSKKWYFYPLAILLHSAIDFVAAYCSLNKVNAILIEGIVYLMAAITAAIAVLVWKNNFKKN